MRHENDFPFAVTEIADQGIVMRDGCRLSARVWMPDEASNTPMPVILEHLPYRKRDGTIARDQFTHPWFAGHGYVCIRTDMRGNGDSDGLMSDEYTEQELQDACDVIAWAASQPWCNGNVGMMGISWGGFNGLQVAALNPPALKAVITICSTVDRYADDIHYKGGCLLLENFGWSANMLSYSSRPPDPKIVGDNRWKDIWLNRLENQPWHLTTWLRHQHRDWYWKHGSVCEDYSAIKAAVLSIGGWHDGYRNTISHLAENLSAPVKGIVGPWNHKYPHYAAPAPAIGFLQEAKRWWDRYLKGIETGADTDPDYRVYLMDSIEPKRWFDHRPGRWIAEQNWPSKAIDQLRLHLRDGGKLSSDSGVCGLSVSSPADCGVAAGVYFPFAFADELPAEQSVDDANSVCFDSAAFDEDIDIVGMPRIQLTVTPDKTRAQVAVRLCDIRPDGTSALITYGILNVCHHSSHEFPTPLVPGQPVDLEFGLDQIACRLPKGHKLRVALSTNYWPLAWPSPELATLLISEGSVQIPTRPLAQEDEVQFEEPVGAPAWRTETLRPSSYSRTTTTDPRSKLVTTVIESDGGEIRDLEHGLISGSKLREEFHILPDDPLSARATAVWEQTGGREGQMWRTHASAEMTSDETHFHSKAVLQAFENGSLIFEREYQDSVERDLV